ncbi:hypothetical protein, partial [Streptomyces sp. XY593]|uniref:hypothetical protein n=1 Tax=Streptomyces sp. XY593 TaxID=1519483 RepID=UPI001F32F606
PPDPHRIRDRHDHTGPPGRVTEPVTRTCTRPDRHPESWADAGAHELAASERRGGFGHWGGLDLDVPLVELAPGLSNIDEVMAALFQELRSKGIELK